MNIRWIPKVNFINFDKEFPNRSTDSFKRWFSIDRMWSGKLIYITVKHYSLVFDFRKDWVADMIGK